MAIELVEDVAVIAAMNDTVTGEEVGLVIIPMRTRLVVLCPSHHHKLWFEVDSIGIDTAAEGPYIVPEVRPVKDYPEGVPALWTYTVKDLVSGHKYEFHIHRNEENEFEFGYTQNPETISVCVTNGQYRLMYYGDLNTAVKAKRPNVGANN